MASAGGLVSSLSIGRARLLLYSTALLFICDQFFRGFHVLLSDETLASVSFADSTSFAAPRIETSSRSLSSFIEDLTEKWHALEDETYEVYPKLYPAMDPADSDEITVTVHQNVDVEKFRRLLFVQHRWGGPISLAILLKAESDIALLRTFLHDNHDALSRTTLHIVMEKTKAAYPHNTLRELALQNIDSDYFLTLDVDFVTAPHAHELLYDLLHQDPSVGQAMRNQTLMVLPAFNLERQLTEDEIQDGDQFLPSDRREAIQWVNSGNITEFHVSKFFQGHGPTNFTHWYTDMKNTWYLTHYHFKFEPYVMGYKEGVPHFWEGFRGFGYNKYSWFVEAHYKGYKFGVLRDHFVVHLDHPYNDDRKSKSINNHRQIEFFKSYLTRTYGVHEADLPQIASLSMEEKLQDQAILEAVLRSNGKSNVTLALPADGNQGLASRKDKKTKRTAIVIKNSEPRVPKREPTEVVWKAPKKAKPKKKKKGTGKTKKGTSSTSKTPSGISKMDAGKIAAAAQEKEKEKESSSYKNNGRRRKDRLSKAETKAILEERKALEKKRKERYAARQVARDARMRRKKEQMVEERLKSQATQS